MEELNMARHFEKPVKHFSRRDVLLIANGLCKEMNTILAEMKNREAKVGTAYTEGYLEGLEYAKDRVVELLDRDEKDY